MTVKSTILWCLTLFVLLFFSITIIALAEDQTAADNPFHLEIELSEGQSQARVTTVEPPATGVYLKQEEIDQILNRLPKLEPSGSEIVEFKLPEESLLPPTIGTTIQEPFPPLTVTPVPEEIGNEPLEVIRYSPEGEIETAPVISITFNQPMVAISTLQDLEFEEVPVKIEPNLPGTWQWLGTKTLTFQYDSESINRLPKATEYQVTIPKGTKSVSGQELQKDVTWTFTTPPPAITEIWPNPETPLSLEPIFYLSFNQQIDPASVLNTITLQSAAGEGTVPKTFSLTLVDEAEITSDSQLQEHLKNAVEGRWLAFRPDEPLESSSNYSLIVGPGTPSAEGPLVNKAVQNYSFKTYEPLAISDYYCYWNNESCPPFSPLTMEFNNELDQELFKEEWIRFEPEIPGLTFSTFNNVVYLQGQTKGRTIYTATISADLQDIYGQKLGKDTRVTFKIGAAEKDIIGPDRNFVTLDPHSSQPIFSFHAINHEWLNVQIYSVQPSDWTDFQFYAQNWQYEELSPQMPGILLADRKMNLNLPKDELTQIDINLQEFMSSSSGHFAIIVQPPKSFFESDEEQWKRFYQTIIVWVQISHIGLDAFFDHSNMIVRATDLQTGSPIPNVEIASDNGEVSAVTGGDGLAKFAIPSGALYLTGTSGSETAILPRSPYYWYQDAWQALPPQDEIRWYVFDDRKLYRPGEEVHVKGWIRQIGGGQDGDVQAPDRSIKSVNYSVSDSQNNVIANGLAEIHGLGGFDFAIKIPENVNLGNAIIGLTAESVPEEMPGKNTSHSFQIEEFRRPEFEVTVQNESAGPFYISSDSEVARAITSVKAAYYAGDPLTNADVTWKVTPVITNYAPPNWPDYTFGTWKPWWTLVYDYGDYGYEDESNQLTYEGKTDASGMHYLAIDLDSSGDKAIDPSPYTISAEATVMDVNRQAWTDSSSFIVHPAEVYIGLRSDHYFVPMNQPLKIDFIVTDVDGLVVPDQSVEMIAGRLTWKNKKGNWVEELTDPVTCSTMSGKEPGSCEFETSSGGTYQITAIVTDGQGRKNQTRITRWVSGAGSLSSGKLVKEEVTLIPDAEIYQPDDTASILVQAPFSPAEGLAIINRSGILSTQTFHMDSESYTLEIPILDTYIPNIDIEVELVGVSDREHDESITASDLPKRAAFAGGTLSLNIPPLSRSLSLDVTPDVNELEPGEETTLTVSVKNAKGEPVPDAELAIAVVDESVLALTGFQLPDPVQIFYSYRFPSFEGIYGRASIMLTDPWTLTKQSQQKSMDRLIGGRGGGGGEMAMMPMFASGKEEKMFEGGEEDKTIEVRTDFNPLAAFAPSVRTGLDGTARIPVQVPDNLTRYRIMVAAVDPDWKKFGIGESSLTVRLPLMVRPSLPRFLNFGDIFKMPVVIQNQTAAMMDVIVAAQTENLALLHPGMRVNVPAHSRIEVQLDASTVSPGKARIQIAAISDTGASDAALVELPVYTPASSESFATYGILDEGTTAQAIDYPADVFTQFGGLEITTSATALQSLTDAIIYLTNYPFECSEQLSSRILAITSLRDILSAFKAEGLPPQEELEAAVKSDISRLAGMQNSDGGFPTWQRGFESNPFNSVHTAHALFRAAENGYDVPAEMQQSVLGYMQNLKDHFPAWYSEQTKISITAYALYVRDLMGDRDSVAAENLILFYGLDAIPIDAIGWLWPLIDLPDLISKIQIYVMNHTVETAGAANFVTAYDDQSYLLLRSDRRTDAILLSALIKNDPKSDLIPKVVNGLLASRNHGRWSGTQDNVFVLLALNEYFRKYEAIEPDFVAQMWLGDSYAGKNEFHNRTTEQHEILIPMVYILSKTAGGQEDLILSKEGPGRLYYRLGLKYVPNDLNLPPLDAGFYVSRTYEALDDPSDVTRDADGTWHIRAGARVRIRISMAADNRRYHVALVDPLPAGLEILNPELSVTGSLPQNPADRSGNCCWWLPWYEHQNMRDEQIEAFTSLLWEGAYEYSYFARATTPGSFIVPPAKAEEMYSPEVFGRSGSDLVIVE